MANAGPSGNATNESAPSDKDKSQSIVQEKKPPHDNLVQPGFAQLGPFLTKVLDESMRDNIAIFSFKINKPAEQIFNLTQKIILEIKNRLGEKEPSPKNVKNIIDDWKTQVEHEQQIAAGNILPPPASKEPPKEKVEDQFTAALSVREKQLLLRTLAHLSTVPSSIAFEIQYWGISEKTDEKLVQAAVLSANKTWEEVEKAKIARLAELGGETWAKNVENWLKNETPQALTYEQMQHRNVKRDVRPKNQSIPLNEQTKVQREKAMERVRGYQPVSDYNVKAGTAAKEAKRLKVHRRMGEHPESERQAMQLRHGILPISTSRQGGLWAKVGGALGIGKWQNNFELDPENNFASYPKPEDRKPHRAKLDSEHIKQKKFTFPERRELAQTLAEKQRPERYFAHMKRCIKQLEAAGAIDGSEKSDLATKKDYEDLMVLFQTRLKMDEKMWSKDEKSKAEFKRLMELDKDPAVDELVERLGKVTI